MKKPDWTIERTEIERIAHEYTDQGYEVVVEPSGADLPDFVREYTPDLIAKRGKDCLIIEIKQPRPDAERDRIRAIAERVQSQPGWRFVLISPQERPPNVITAEAVQTPDDKYVRALAQDARRLLNEAHYEAALLLAWSAVEGAMRVAASRANVDVKRPDTWSLMRELVSVGLLDRHRYTQLSDVFRWRSALAHGFATPNKTQGAPEVVDLAIKVAEELLRETH